jgi:hypothetical protein
MYGVIDDMLYSDEGLAVENSSGLDFAVLGFAFRFFLNFDAMYNPVKL